MKLLPEVCKTSKVYLKFEDKQVWFNGGDYKVQQEWRYERQIEVAKRMYNWM